MRGRRSTSEKTKVDQILQPRVAGPPSRRRSRSLAELLEKARGASGRGSRCTTRRVQTRCARHRLHARTSEYTDRRPSELKEAKVEGLMEPSHRVHPGRDRRR